jgi:hypothetical protein
LHLLELASQVPSRLAGLNRLAAGQIIDGAGWLEHAVEGAGGEVKLVYGGVQESLHRALAGLARFSLSPQLQVPLALQAASSAALFGRNSSSIRSAT